MVLKRLRDAERDGDRIYAVLKGVGLASDGRGRGLASPEQQGPCPRDPAGLSSLRASIRRRSGSSRGMVWACRPPIGPSCAHCGASSRRPKGGARVLGAVSSLIGHAMPAAGMAGLIKTALALHHRVLPPTLRAERPAPAARRKRPGASARGPARGSTAIPGTPAGPG